MAGVFISYSRVDRGLAEDIFGWLTRDGHEVFLDRAVRGGIPVGDNWQERLYRELARVDAVVCLITRAYLGSVWCTAEAAIADWRGCLVIPVCMEQGLTHPLLSRWQHTGADPEQAREQVLARLRLVDTGGRPEWRGSANPYPGLKPFTPELSQLFFGRGDEVRRLSAKVRGQGGREIIAIAGPSGCGKSSLLGAGLVPVMETAPGWLVVHPWAPSGDPKYELAQKIVDAAGRLRLPWDVRYVLDRLTGARGLRELADELLRARRPVAAEQVLVTIDQAEQLFDPQISTECRAELVELLSGALAGAVRLVVTVRADYLSDLRDLFPDLRDSFLLGPLARDMLRLAIEEPAKMARLPVEPELSARLIADTASGDALPLLAFALHELADPLKRGEPLTLDAYVNLAAQQGYPKLSGLNAVLAHHADDALTEACLSSMLSREDVLAALVRMVSVDDAGRWAGRPVDPAKLTAPMRTALAEFVRRRLLTTDRRQLTADGHSDLIRFAHEALMTAWPPLEDALNERGTALRTARQVEQAATEWDDARRADGYLWDQERYAATMLDLGGPAPLVEPADPGPAFLAATRARIARTRRRERIRRARAVTVLSALLAVAVVAGLIAKGQASSAQAARDAAQAARDAATVRGLTARADAIRVVDPKLALRLGVAAHALAPNATTDASLVHTLTMNNYAATLKGHTSSVFAAAFSPDGRILATGDGDDHTVRLWDVADLVHPRPLGRPITDNSPWVQGVAFAPDGAILATASRAEVILWDVTDPAHPRKRGTIPAPRNNVSTTDGMGIAFSPAGRLLASTHGGVVALWNVARPDRPTMVGHPLAEHGDSLSDVAFSTDGRTLAATVSSYDGGSLRLWDVTDPRHPRPTGGRSFDQPVTALAFLPNRPILAVAHGQVTDRGSVDLWNIPKSGGPQRIGSPLFHSGGVADVAFKMDGRTMATAGEDNTVLLWDVTDPERPQRIGDPLADHTNVVHAVAFRADGAMASASADNTVVLWAGRNLTQPVAWDLPQLNHDGPVTALAFAPDGRTLAASAEKGAARLWDLSNPARPRGPGEIPDDDGPISALAFRPNGAVLATGSGRDSSSGQTEPNPVLLWDTGDPAHPRRLGKPLDGNTDRVVSLSFSTDGRTLWSANRNVTLFRWDVADPERPQRTTEALHGRTDSQDVVAFRPDQRAIASGGTWSYGEDVVLRDITDPGKVRLLGSELTDHRAYTVVFSPDGTLLASGGRDVLLWDVSTAWQPRRYGSPLGAGGDVRSLAITADGQILVVGGADGAITVWNIADRTQPYRIGPPLTKHHHAITATAVSPDGRLLATGDDAGTVVMWSMAQLREIRDHPVEAACARAGRDLSQDEWTRHVGPTLPYRRTCPDLH